LHDITRVNVRAGNQTARKIMIKLSVTSKLDGIRSWSLQALDTCPGSIAAPGERGLRVMRVMRGLLRVLSEG